MIKIIDTLSQIDSLFDNGNFNIEKWENYINSTYARSAGVFKKDLKEYLESGNYVYEKDILPIINSVYNNISLQILQTSFNEVTDKLNSKIKECFDNELDVDIVLYLGLCNGAGWVNNINGRDVILLGVEKILELNWCDKDSLYGLIYHELGHVYHKQYGVFEQQSEDNGHSFVWQLFVEGIAMYFEQVLVGDINYFHQNKNGWLDWCEKNFYKILSDFNTDLPCMTRFNQRYFGDWVDYYGRSDVGYFLGARFVKSLCRSKFGFEELIKMRIDEIYREFCEFSEKYTIHKLFSKCGMRCDLCLIYRPNVEKQDRRTEICNAWKKMWEGFEPDPNTIICDGCCCEGEEAILFSPQCETRKCVVEKGFAHCGYCEKYPCSIFPAEPTKEETIYKIEVEKQWSWEDEKLMEAYACKKNIDEFRRNK